MALTPVVEDQLWGLYKPYPKHRVTSASFTHPAKMAWSLCAWIMQHLRDEGWAQPGAVICDPMAGICTTLLLAADAGFQAWGVELESHFFSEAQANIALNRHVWEQLGKPIPRIVQGDARNLLTLVREAGIVVSSPPYAQSVHDGNGIDHTKFRGKPAGRNSQASAQGYSTPAAVISSPPFADQGVPDARHLHFDARRREASIAQKQREGVPDGYSRPNAIISSPPYADGSAHTGGADSHPQLIQGGHTGHVLQSYSEPVAIVSSPPFHSQMNQGGDTPAAHGRGRHTREPRPSELNGSSRIVTDGFGNTAGQLGSLPMGDVQAVISSPPYAQIAMNGGTKGLIAHGTGLTASEPSFHRYGLAQGNIGNMTCETYWDAMACIYAQCYQILSIGGHIVLVLKSFVRQGRIVDLPGQTAQLLEHIGFKVVHMHRAMLTSQVAQLTLEGGEERKSRKSFFRRLSEKNGAPPIDFETVICAVKE